MKRYLFSSKKAVLVAMLLLACIAGYSQLSTVSSSTVWNSSRVISEDVIIHRNCTLTINSSTIYFANRVKIVVESGGLLNLNGCRLTSQNSNGKWGGIEVRGLLKVNRSDAEQGMVNATGSTIENAILGIGAGKIIGYDPTCVPDPDIPIFDTETSGGKIIATNCMFKNNNQAVAINSFGNINNGSENTTNYNGSTFTECTFTVTKNVLREGFVSLCNVRNVYFYGCDFSVDITQSQLVAWGYGSMKIEGYIEYLKGIMAYNSNFKVTKTSQSGNKRSSFDNLGYGIYVDGITGSPSYFVRYTDFYTLRGVYNGMVNNPIIADCYFLIRPSYTTTYSYYNYGIYLDHSTGYFVEGNVFDGYKMAPGPEFTPPYWALETFGVIVNESGGTNANKIYNNEFKYLEYGVSAQGVNREHNSNGGAIGLCVICNDFTDVVNDISVVHGKVASEYDGIASRQKNGSRPAGNRLTNRDFSCLKQNLYNECNFFNYELYGDEPTPVTVGNIYLTITWNSESFDKKTHCPRRIIYEAVDIPSVTDLVDQRLIANSLKAELKSNIDGGDSEELISSINTATVNDANMLRESLLSTSPYLSTEALKATVENEEAINNTTLRDVMVGNAKSTQDESVMGLVNDRVNPLPNYMYDQVEQAMQIESERDVLEAEILSSILDYNATFTNLANSYADNDNIQEWESLMSDAMIIDQQYDLAIYSKLKGDNAKVNSILSSITTMIGDDETLQVEHEAYTDYLNIINNNVVNGVISEVELSALTLLAQSDTKAGLLATKILKRHEDVRYEEPIYLPTNDMMKRSKVDKPQIAESASTNLNIYPNPAKGSVIIAYDAIGCSDDLMLTITDMKGDVQYSEKLQYVEDSKYINIEKLPQGNYVVNVLSEGNVVYTNKLIIK